MRKRCAIILGLVVLAMASLAGCGRRGACERCGQEGELHEYVFYTYYPDGSKQATSSDWLCDYCYDMHKFLFSK